MPPIAAINGVTAFLNEDKWPEVSSRFISRPTTKKKIVIKT
ncbi:unannotated protein [freshwater metagenome]|uniref:Unannotated protein n=1 Tax=freshwater metagenome TaxID=449393 RepID=A0A6J6V8P7_9ZZZZ